MAKKRVNKKKRFKRRIVILGISGLLLIGIVGFGFSIFLDAKNMVPGQSVSEEKKNEYYAIRSNATAYQKELYEKLTNQLNDGYDFQDEDAKVSIAKTIVQSFVADFYTWTNKAGNYDVGGLEYIYSSNLKNFNKAARDRFYNQLSSDIDQYGQENLLEVTEVSVNGSYAPEKFIRNDQTMETFYIEASWNYKTTTGFDTSKYQTKGYFTVIINESGRYEIVSYLKG